MAEIATSLTATEGAGLVVGRAPASVHLGDGPEAEGYEDIRRGLSGLPLSLPPRYFYDDVGSRLFEEITRLPEYYLTRAEKSILMREAGSILAEVGPAEIVEIGCGSTEKVRLVLDADRADQRVRRYVAVDLDRWAIDRAVDEMGVAYPHIETLGAVGDFERHLDRLPPPAGIRLVVFLGSTIGNLDLDGRIGLLGRVRRLMGPADRFLLGVDLVKETAVLEAAYNDSAGVTAEFNRNILRVVNQAVGGDFRPDEYEHLAFYDARHARVEMHLVARTAQTAWLGAFDLAVDVAAGDTIWTESSYKFTRESVEAELDVAGLHLERWLTDTDGMFGLLLARSG